MSDFVWTQPKRLDIEGHRPFPVDVLPDVLKDMALARAKGLNCDPSLVIGPMLAVVGAACGAAKIRLDKRGEWEEPGPLWTMTVADPASRKSAALGSVLGALTAAQKEAIEEDRKTRPAKNLRIKQAEKRIKKAEIEYGELLDSDDPVTDADITAAEEAVNSAHQHLAAVCREVGVPPMVYAGTHSGAEKLHDMLADHKNLLLYIAEGDTFFRKVVTDKLDRDVFLSSWSMEDLKRNLVSREVSIAESPSLNFGINVQVKIILDVLKSGGDVLTDVGLFDRFLDFVPDTSQLQVGHFDDLSDPDLFCAEAQKSPEMMAFFDVIRREVRRTLPLRGEATKWALDAGAATVQKARHAEWAAYQHNYTSTSKGVLGKLAGQAIRLARIFAQAAMDDTGMNPFGGSVTPLDTETVYPIPAWAVEAGWLVAWFCFHNAEYLFGDALSKDMEHVEFSRILLRKARQLSDEGVWSFKVRDLQNSRMRKYTADELRGGLTALTDAGWFMATPTTRDGVFMYHTHPDLVRWIKEYGL